METATTSNEKPEEKKPGYKTSLDAVLGKTFSIFTQNFGRFMLMSIAVILFLLVGGFFYGGGLNGFQSELSGPSELIADFIFTLLFVIPTIWMIFFGMESYLKKEKQNLPKKTLKEKLKNYLPFAGIALLFSAISLLTTFLQQLETSSNLPYALNGISTIGLVAEIYILVKLTFSRQYASLENKSIVEALKKSFQLSKNRGWKIIGYYLVFIIIIGLAGLLIMFLLLFGVAQFGFNQLNLSANGLASLDPETFANTLLDNASWVLILLGVILALLFSMVVVFVNVFSTVLFLEFKKESNEKLALE